MHFLFRPNQKILESAIVRGWKPRDFFFVCLFFFVLPFLSLVSVPPPPARGCVCARQGQFFRSRAAGARPDRFAGHRYGARVAQRRHWGFLAGGRPRGRPEPGAGATARATRPHPGGRQGRGGRARDARKGEGAQGHAAKKKPKPRPVVAPQGRFRRGQEGARRGTLRRRAPLLAARGPVGACAEKSTSDAGTAPEVHSTLRLGRLAVVWTTRASHGRRAVGISSTMSI